MRSTLQGVLQLTVLCVVNFSTRLAPLIADQVLGLIRIWGCSPACWQPGNAGGIVLQRNSAHSA